MVLKKLKNKGKKNRAVKVKDMSPAAKAHERRYDHLVRAEKKAKQQAKVEKAKRGLYNKFIVYKSNPGGVARPIKGCFVLRPETDKHAITALRFYADLVRVENEKLSDDLLEWLVEFEHTT
jgi:hypothetical protein